jgi:hypothetical protein
LLYFAILGSIAFFLFSLIGVFAAPGSFNLGYVSARQVWAIRAPMALGAFFAMVYLISKIEQSQRFAKDPWLLEPVTVDLTEKNLIVSQTNVKTIYGWPRIEQINIAPDYIYLFISNSTKYFIPKHAFADSDRYYAFGAQALKYKQGSSENALVS